MRKIHVTQDDYGFWFVSLEEPDGSMKLVAHHYSAAGPAIEDAKDFINEEQRTDLESVGAQRMMLLVDSPQAHDSAAITDAAAEYRPPQPKRAGE